MAKKKKQYAPIPTSKKNKSRTEQERCYPVAKKVLRHFGLDPELIDRFTKKQKQYLLANWCNPPIVRPEKERTVPRQYVRNIHAEMYQFMKTNFWGDPDNQLTYMELATYGFSFLMNIYNMHIKYQALTGTPQEEIARQICEKFDKDDIFYHSFEDVLYNIWHKTRCYSKINYRFYGFKYLCENVTLAQNSGTTMRMTILLTARECEEKKFTHNNIERKAYRMLDTANGVYKPVETTIPRSKIFPHAKEDEKLNIYIQSHVLHRFKERMDLFPPEAQNLYIQYAFTHGLQLVSNGQQQLFVCAINKHPIGYFTYFIQDNDIVISTFIPLVSKITPEGKKLCKLLAFGKDETIYLGMDKVSFFYKVDFEQIPALKQALVDSGIWQAKLILDEMLEENEIPPIDTNKTTFVKNFIQQHQEG